jgi:hypothetical protein
LLEATPAGFDAFGDSIAGWLGEYYEPTPLEPSTESAGSSESSGSSRS